MKPIAFGREPPSLADYAVTWDTLVADAVRVPADYHPYLGALARYTNAPAEDGLFVVFAELRHDADFARVIAAAHTLPTIQRDLAVKFLASTSLANSLAPFSGPETLASRLSGAALRYLRPFYLEGVLAETLYFYGMYSHFYEEHSAREAVELARSFVISTIGDDLDTVLVYQTHAPWGAWFDPHSCTDQTIVMLSLRRLTAWLLCCSHSD